MHGDQDFDAIRILLRDAQNKQYHDIWANRYASDVASLMDLVIATEARAIPESEDSDGPTA